MMTIPRFDAVARLAGDPSRATMLEALLDGRAWTGRELAERAHVTPSTASEHLGRLVDGALLRVVPQGRHRYYRIASAEVTHAIEALMFLAPPTPAQSTARRAIDLELKRARTCYDHLAGELGVAICDALVRKGAILFGQHESALTPMGNVFLEGLGIELDRVSSRRTVCRPCLDWSERRFHLAGSVGAALSRHAFEQRWLRRQTATRAVIVTDAGVDALRNVFGLEWHP